MRPGRQPPAARTGLSPSPGALSAALDELITAVRGLDMDAVRSKVAQPGAGDKLATVSGQAA